jgi:dTDP-4-amino-4,6-dideoxygalactose transaminase
VKLKYLDEDIAWRVVAWRAAIAMASVIRTSLPSVAREEQHAWHLFVVRCTAAMRLQQHLQAHGIQSQVHYPVPPHRQPAYASLRIISFAADRTIA